MSTTTYQGGPAITFDAHSRLWWGMPETARERFFHLITRISGLEELALNRTSSITVTDQTIQLVVHATHDTDGGYPVWRTSHTEKQCGLSDSNDDHRETVKVDWKRGDHPELAIMLDAVAQEMAMSDEIPTAGEAG